VTKEGSEYLYYSYDEEPPPSSSLYYEDKGSVERRADELSASLTTTKYEVVLVDGKLINYKELKD
jgi:hypothetical protein